MFLRDLSTNEKQLFLGLARAMISADEKLTAEEIAMLGDVALEMGVESDVEVTSRGVAELSTGITDPRTQAIMLLELASLAHVDGEYADEERQLLRAIARIWKFGPITLTHIETWAKTRIDLSREAAEIILEAASPLARS